MRSVYFFIAAALALFTFSGCSKDDSNPGTPQSRLKTYTEYVKSSVIGEYSATYTLNYDQQGRIVSMIDAANQGNKFLFTHNNGGFDFDIYASGEVVIHELVFFNGSLMDSTIQYNDEGDTTSEKYVYNADKLLTQVNRYVRMSSEFVLDDVVHYTYDSDKRLLSEQDNFSVINYEYTGSYINNINLFPLYTSSSIALPSRAIYNYGGEQTIIEHVYTFDDQKRLTQDKGVIVGSSDEVTKSFTYE